MLFGLANDLIWPAILMVLAISAGMALAMSAIGIAALWGRSLAERRLGSDAQRLQRFERVARLTGALCVLAIGSVLFGVTATLQPVSQLPMPELAMQLDQ
jgi:ABC-type nickel/cobalt efflux system permease component RcnA